MTQAEEILKKAINEYCDGAYAKSSMSAVDYSIAIYAIEQTLDLFSVSNNASEFEKDLYKLINAYCKKGLSKPDLMNKMQYVSKSCELS